MHAGPSTLVCFAVKEEAKFFKPLAVGRPNIQILLTGMGSANAANALQRRLANAPPGLVEAIAMPLAAKPGYRRVGYVVQVDGLVDVVRALDGAKIPIEHLFDY